MTLYRFGGFELSTERYELRCRGEAVKMEPQVFEVLAYLVRHHERLVGKDELLESIWGDKYVSEAALNSRMMAARRAIGDSGREQRLIQTLHGRGYRFVAAVEVVEAVEAEQAFTSTISVEASPVLALDSRDREVRPAKPALGRESELAQLAAWLEEARQGRRQIVFVTGEAGIGKTTLLDAFARQTGTDAVTTLGQCLEQRGGGEAYLPILEALERLARGARRQDARQLLLRSAPSWAAQMPGVFSPEEQFQAQQRSIGTTGERMLREGVGVLETLASQMPLVVVLEDMHWSDEATLDLLSGLARRREPARLMIVASYRPGDARAGGHSVDRLQQELRLRSLCRELAVPPLPLSAVRELVQSRLPAAAPGEVALALQRRAEGNALFLTTLVEELATRGEQAVATEAIEGRLPASLRLLIEHQIERLGAADLSLLEAASVAGPEFASTEVAAATGETLDTVEARAEALARHGNLIARLEDAAEWPDGSLAMRYGFVHGLYQEVLYERLTPARKARLHLDVGKRLEAAYGRQAAAHATELAMHFAAARDGERAVRYLELAAAQAKSRGAYREAAAHLGRALDIVTQRSDLEERAAQEIALRSGLGSALLVTHGFGHDAVLEQFTQALELAERSGDTAVAQDVVLNLAALMEYRSEHRQAEDILLRLEGRREAEPSLRLPFHALLTCSYFHQGAFGKSVEQGRQGLSLADPENPDARFASLGEDPGNGCSEWSAQALWFLGYPEQALQAIEAAVALASRPDRQYALASALSHAARIHQLRREPERALAQAQATSALAGEQGYVYHYAVAMVLAGWAKAMLGNADGAREIHEGIAAHEATGAGMDRPYFLALLADALLAGGDQDGALGAIAQAFKEVPPDRNFFYEAELQRLQGVALAASNNEDDAPMSCLRRAVAIAREQDAKSLELRAATSLARELQRRGQAGEGREVLEPALAWFSEGFETRDYREARELLKSL